MSNNKSVVDRFFEFSEKHVRALILGGVLVGAAGVYFQYELGSAVDRYRSLLSIGSLVLGPVASALGFYLGYRSKKAMVEHSIASEDKLTELAAELQKKSFDIGVLNEKLNVNTQVLADNQAALKAKSEELEIENKRVQFLDANLRRVTDGGHSLWRASPPRPFERYQNWQRDPKGAKIVSIGNLKGGVGKTTIAANLAAYISTKQEKPVLLIDLDYQGSLSNMLMFAAGYEEVPSNVDVLFTKQATLETLATSTVHLHRKLAQAWLVPSSYSFGSTEGRLLLEWLMDPTQGTDARYRIAELLLNPAVRQRYSVIILDMPPRLTLGSINALVASHFLLVPSMLDKLSGDAVRQFLAISQEIASDMELDLKLLGAVGTMSRQQELNEREKLIWRQIGDDCRSWADRDARFSRTIPIRSAIAKAAGEDVAYLTDVTVKSIFNELGDEIWERLFPRPTIRSETADFPQEVGDEGNAVVGE